MPNNTEKWHMWTPSMFLMILHKSCAQNCYHIFGEVTSCIHVHFKQPYIIVLDIDFKNPHLSHFLLFLLLFSELRMWHFLKEAQWLWKDEKGRGSKRRMLLWITGSYPRLGIIAPYFSISGHFFSISGHFYFWIPISGHFCWQCTF